MKRLALLSAIMVFATPFHAYAAATVTLGGESYTLDTVTCSGSSGSFSIQARSTSATRLLQLGAFNGEVKSVGFRVDDTLAQVADRTGSYDGKTFTFKGEAQVYTANSFNRQILTVSASC